MDSPFLGMVQYFAFGWAPKGYALCNGALLSIQQNAALFSLLGTYYGGNGVNTFALPDLQGRSIISQSNSFTMGEKLGTATASLLTSNMPLHSHTASGAIGCNTGNGTQSIPTGGFPAVPVTSGRGGGPVSVYGTPATGSPLGGVTVTVGATGSAVPFNTQNPYLAVTACIATIGLFPSRN